MTLEILSVNLDSLYLSLHGDLNGFASAIIPAAKQQAQDDDKDVIALPQLEGIPGGRFFVSRKGVSRDYPYSVSNARFRLAMTKRGGSRPTITMQINSNLLYEYELEEIEIFVQRIGGLFLDRIVKTTVSRADVALDFQDPTWEYPEMAACKTRAKSRFVHYEGQNVTGMTFGRHQGAMQVQIYNKSETLKGDGKEWMKEIWAASGQYEEDLPVQRIELRFYRQILREMKNEDGSLCTISDLRNSLGDLATYAVNSAKPYFRVLDPLEVIVGLNVRNSERVSNAGWWEIVKRGFDKLTGSQVRKRVQDDAKFVYTQAVARAASALSTAAAISRSQNWHTAASPAQFAKDRLRAFFEGESSLWSEMVNQKLEDLRGKIEAVPRPELALVAPINPGKRSRDTMPRHYSPPKKLMHDLTPRDLTPWTLG